MKIKLSQDNLPEYFTIADITNSWHKIPTNTFNFISRNSDSLLVTVGDSWTWGSDISEGNLNDNYRVDNVWGNQLSKLLKSDWLNLALCAQSNQWMADRCKEFYDIADKLEYKSIKLICVFTGAGRMFNTGQDCDFDYVRWFANNAIDDFLLMLNKKCVDIIQHAPDIVDVYITSNTVDSLGYQERLLPWYKILGYSDSTPVYTDMTAIKKLQQIEEFVSGKKKDLFKIWMLETIDKVEIREKWFNNSKIFRNCHPLAEYHQRWAEYLYKEIV